MIERLSAHLGYMFADEPLSMRFESAARCGFTAVEHPGPYDMPAGELRRILADNGLAFVQMALPSGDAARGEKGLACLSDRQADFDAALERGLDYAAAIGCTMVHMMSGVVPRGTERADLWPLYTERLAQAAHAAAARGIVLLVEPIGRATIADYFIDDPYLGLRALDAVDADNVRLLFDAFHATNAGIDAVRFFTCHAHRIAHLHIADHPGRHEPGTGCFAFGRLFAALDACGYSGRIGLEYVPADDTRAGLFWIGNYLS